MNIVLTANIVPFMPGGADYHIQGVIHELRKAGHQVEAIRFPFRFSPEADIQNLMDYCDSLNFEHFNGISVDKVISLQFPAYGVQHPDHTVWIMHQHRAVYELYEADKAGKQLQGLRDKVVSYDNYALGRARQLFANSGRVAERLKQFNQLVAEPLYHPPYMADSFYNEEDYGYIFCPSRLESLKRQTLLIEAMRYCQTDVKAIIAGDGGQKEHYQHLIELYQLGDKVRLIGRFSEQEKFAYYARALAVFFAPFDEDYGYITLEGMLSAKPVITCTDSGGPLEFVEHDKTGFVLEPDPEQIAEKLDQLYQNRKLAADMGQEGLSAYHAANISWPNVVEKLLR
ncbi:MAG: glycosyltransferase family 4 protein [Neptuniibacter sp.]